MSGSVNKAIIVGNVGQDPDVRTFQNGGKVVNLSVATSETWRDKQSGEKKERVQWHRVAIFNEGIAGVAERFVKKGSKVYIEGQIETRKYQDQQGNDRFTTEIVLRPYNGTLTLLGDPSNSRGDRGGDDRGGSDFGGGGARGGSHGASGGGGGGFGGGFADDLEDDIPF